MDKAELETTQILAVRWDERGLAQAVATDTRTGALLMAAYTNAAALEQTIATGKAPYWSRSRQDVWHKGRTSGNGQQVVDRVLNCDREAYRRKGDEVETEE